MTPECFNFHGICDAAVDWIKLGVFAVGSEHAVHDARKANLLREHLMPLKSKFARVPFSFFMGR